MDADKSLYPATSFPSDIITLEQAAAAGIPKFPGAEAFEVYPLMRMTYQDYAKMRNAQLCAVAGKWDA
jgi:hypothetical protein